MAVLPANPAAAASTSLCLPVSGNGSTILDWVCPPVAVVECQPPCGPWAMDLKERIILPREQEFRYVEALGNGLALVSQALVERDPAVVARLLEQAEAQFLASAAILEGTGIAVGAVGFADLRRNQVVADPSLGWLEVAGTDVGNGIWHMQMALTDPFPDPWIDAAMDSFLSAASHIAYGR